MRSRHRRKFSIDAGSLERCQSQDFGLVSEPLTVGNAVKENDEVTSPATRIVVGLVTSSTTAVRRFAGLISKPILT